MGWHRHHWVTHHQRWIDSFDDPNRPPVRTETEFSQTCAVCGKPRTKRIDGKWVPPDTDEAGGKR